MDKERIKEIFSDEEFVVELLGLENPEDAQALLKTKGIDLELDQVRKMGEIINKQLNAVTAEEGEISEEDLEDVSGGGWFAIVMPIITTVATCIYKSIKCRW